MGKSMKLDYAAHAPPNIAEPAFYMLRFNQLVDDLSANEVSSSSVSRCAALPVPFLY